MEQSVVYNRIENHFRTQQERIVKRFTRYLGNRERAEDIASEAFTRALTYWKTCPEIEEEFSPWFNTILNNCAKVNHKEEASRGMLNYEETESVEKPVAIPRIIINEVMEVVNEKQPMEATVLKMYFLNGYSNKEISEIVDEKLSAVKMTISRFRQEVKEKFKWSI